MLKISATKPGVIESLPQLKPVRPKVIDTVAQKGMEQLNGNTDAPEMMSVRDRMALAERRSAGGNAPKAAVLPTPGSPKSPKKSAAVDATKGAPRAPSPANLSNGGEGIKEAAPLASTNPSASPSSPKLTPEVVKATVPKGTIQDNSPAGINDDAEDIKRRRAEKFGARLKRAPKTEQAQSSNNSNDEDDTKIRREKTFGVELRDPTKEQEDVDADSVPTTQKINCKALAMFTGLPAAFLLVTGIGYLTTGAFAATLITGSGYSKALIAKIYIASGAALALIASFACDARKARPSVETPDVASTSWKVNINAKSALLGVAAAFLLVTGVGFLLTKGAFAATLIPVSSLGKAVVAKIYVASGVVFGLLAAYFALKKPSVETSDVEATADKVRASASPILGQEGEQEAA
jgi:hypothetical protein